MTDTSLIKFKFRFDGINDSLMMFSQSLPPAPAQTLHVIVGELCPYQRHAQSEM